MASPNEKLAKSLAALKALQEEGLSALKSSMLSRTDRERLLKEGFITEVMKGWYIPSSPSQNPGDSTPWYVAYWSFCSEYLNDRFGEDWSVSPEQSLLLHAGDTVVPDQLVVRANKSSNNLLVLPHGTSFLDVKAKPAVGHKQVKLNNGVRAYQLEAALSEVSPTFFKQYPTDARSCLLMVSDASAILHELLEQHKTRAAGRLCGAFRNVGLEGIADTILKTFRSAGFDGIREIDPFEAESPVLPGRPHNNAFATRLAISWQSHREEIATLFGQRPSPPADRAAWLKDIDEIYVEDAYHSLSIEGYVVSEDLIRKVSQGDWQPDESEEDKAHRNALAAKGYWNAFNEVKSSIIRILDGSNPGEVLRHDHSEWYRALFSPSVTAGILNVTDLAGYRNMPVYIRGSKHVPPQAEVVREAMPVLFDCLENEEHPAVRAVLGHFLFVYIHPYVDGNGRTGRFLMNAMLASAGYNWTIVPVEKRDQYMAALERASTEGDMSDFAQLIKSLVPGHNLNQ